MQRDLAIYDMDRTVTRLPTYTSFLIHAARRLAPWRLLLAPAVLVVMAGYVLKLIDRKRLKEINQNLLIGPHRARSELAQVVDSFATLTLETNVYEGARNAIAADRETGRRLVLATASYRLYSQAIADRLGFDDVVATNSIIGLDDRIYARVDGENCYGPAKLRMLLAWMQEQGIARGDVHIRFYSDHASDAPVFEWADEPVAVNAHARLRRLAKARGWRIVDWGR